MADLTPAERLQPALLDRLIDDNPNSQQESREQRVLSVRKLRECVRRDLAWLFNTTHLAAIQSLDDYPLVASSVVNYGTPELSGRALVNLEQNRLERQLRQIILDFEPRILRQTLRINTYVDEQEMSRNAVAFEIEGQLWAQPMPQQLFLKTEVDLEMGDVKIVDYSVQ